MRQLRLLMAAFAAVFGLCVNAQTWTASEVGEGTFYLYNVGAEGYLVGANSWGTQASIAKTGGISVTLASLGEGNYSVCCAPTYQNMYLGANGYIDRPVGESSWSFEAVAGQTNVYKMVCSGGTFSAVEGETTTAVGEDPGTAYAYWKLVSEENRLADLATATADNPKDATFLITNPNFSRNANKTVWTLEASGNTNLSGGANENMCAEAYMATFTLAQELTVPNGLYTFTGQAAVTYHDDRAKKAYDGGDKPELYLGDAVLGFEEMTEEDQLSSMGQLSNAFSAGNYQLPVSDIVSVANGKVTIGARSTRADIWAVWDNFQLQYLGELQDLGPFVEAYEKALAEAQELLNTTEKVSKNALSSLRAATILNGEARVDKNSKESLENATKALNEAIEAVKNSIATYKVIEAGEIPTNSAAGWVATNNEGVVLNTWSTEADNTGMVTPFVQSWINSGEGALSDGMIYYTLEGLNKGEVYYAQALVRAFSEAGYEIGGISFFVNDSEIDMVANGNAYTYNGKPGIYGTFGSIATVGDDGKLTIGVKLNGATFNWVAIKNVTVQSLEAALQASVDKVEAFYGKIPTAVENPTKQFVETTKASVSDEASFQAAVNALNAKADELSPIAKAFADAQALANYKSKYYDAVKEMADVKDYKEYVEGAHDKLDAAVKAFAVPAVDMDALNALTTAEAINDYAQGIAAQAAEADDALRAAGIEYNNNAAPVGDAQFNITFVLTNANLEGLPTWAKCQGWDTERTTGNAQVMVNDRVFSEDGTKTAFYEYWSDPAAADGVFTAYQSVILPEGKYDYSCYAYANPDNQDVSESNVKLYANDFEGPAVASTILAPYSFTFEMAEAGEVKLGLKALEGNQFRWMGIGYVELFRKGIADEPVIPEDPNWEELVINGDVEGTDGTSLVTKNGEDPNTLFFNPVEGAGKDGSKGAVVKSKAGVENDWDTQFFIYEPSHVFAKGEKYKVSFMVKADKEADVDMQAHTTPGNYIGWYVDGAPALHVTSEWQEVSFEGTITDKADNCKMSGMQTIAFNLNKDKSQDNTFYFDNISWKLSKEEVVIPFEITFNPVSGSVVDIDSEITMSFDGDAFNCRYTTDGSDPKTSATVITAKPNEIITVKEEGEFVIKAYLINNKNQEESDIFTANYTVKAANYEGIVLWKGSVLATGWANQPVLLSDGGQELKDADAQVGDVLRFYMSAPDDNWQLELMEGHWSGQYVRWSEKDLGPDRESVVVDLKNTGYAEIEITQEMLDKAYTQGGWGGVFILNGDGNITCTAVTLIKKGVEPAKDLVLTDDDSEAPAPGEYATVTYDRTFLKGYNTIVLPFEYTIAELGADVVMKYVGSKKIEGTDEYHLEFVRMQEEDVLQPNIPYVVFVQVDKKLAGFESNKTVVEPDDLTVFDSNFDFVGSYKAYAKGESPVKHGDYIFRYAYLTKAKGGNEHQAFRAYMKNNTGIEANLYIMVDGELTGIYNIENAENADGRIYNLNGQRVNDAKKGVFIINGKKVVRK